MSVLFYRKVSGKEKILIKRPDRVAVIDGATGKVDSRLTEIASELMKKLGISELSKGLDDTVELSSLQSKTLKLESRQLQDGSYLLTGKQGKLLQEVQYDPKKKVITRITLKGPDMVMENNITYQQIAGHYFKKTESITYTIRGMKKTLKIIHNISVNTLDMKDFAIGG